MKAATKLFCFFIILILIQQNSIAQTPSPYYHSLRKPGLPAPGTPIAAARTAGFSGTGSNIDVNYYRCQWTINPADATKTLTGTVTVYFTTTQNNVSQISLDFRKSSFNNASTIVTYHGSPVTRSFPASGSVNILNITLPVTLPNNRLDSVSIAYSGVPPAATSQAIGYQRSSGLNMIYTLSESYEDRDWWPCKADMQDKADSLDIIITCPSGYLAAANGALISNTVSAPNRTMFYKHRYPIATYLVAIAVAPYTNYSRGTVNISGTNVPFNYYILSSRTPTAGQLTTMDFCKQEMVAFSNKFGDYPFKNEKYGMYEFAWGGGMEHQTFSAMSWGSLGSWSTIAHELGHQWFGDKVTFATWNDLWLAEGFARYSEALAAELVPGLGQNPSTVRSGFKTSANGTTLRQYGCYIPSASITTSDVLWSSSYGSSVYERGAMVVSMLRTLLGDTKFFEACQNYLNDPALAYKSATTNDLKAHMQAVAGGYDLTPFFDSWVHGNGYPTYTAANAIQWSALGTNRINLRVIGQGKGYASTGVTYHHTPIALRVQGAAGKDTVIVLYDQNGKLSRAGNGIGTAINGNTIAFNIGFTPTSVSFDPFSQTLATGATVVNVTLPVQIDDFTVQEQSFGNELKLFLFDQHNELSKVVLQKSMDGINFTDAGEMVRTGNDNGLLIYKLIDYSPEQEKIFYRAKVVEMSEEKYSKILKVENTKLETTSVTPNPADKQVLVRWSKVPGDNTDADVKLLAIDGRTVWNQKTTDNRINVNTTALTVGTYLVQVRHNDELILNRKLIIRR